MKVKNVFDLTNFFEESTMAEMIGNYLDYKWAQYGKECITLFIIDVLIELRIQPWLVKEIIIQNKIDISSDEIDSVIGEILTNPGTQLRISNDRYA